MDKAAKRKKTWKIVGNIVFWVVLLTIVLYSTVTLFSERENNMTSVFGISALTVQSDSMSPTFDQGDLIFINTNFEFDDLIERFNNGDKLVVTFVASRTTEQGVITFFNTHTVKDIREQNGIYWFDVIGDNAPENSVEQKVGAEIVGVWTGTSWPSMGIIIDNTIDFLKSSTGFLLFIVLPCLAFLVYEIVKFTKIYSQYQLEKHVGDKEKLQAEAIAIAKLQLEKEMAEKAAKENEADKS